MQTFQRTNLGLEKGNIKGYAAGTVLTGEGGDTLYKPSGSASISSSACLKTSISISNNISISISIWPSASLRTNISISNNISSIERNSIKSSSLSQPAVRDRKMPMMSVQELLALVHRQLLMVEHQPGTKRK